MTSESHDAITGGRAPGSGGAKSHRLVQRHRLGVVVLYVEGEPRQAHLAGRQLGGAKQVLGKTATTMGRAHRKARDERRSAAPCVADTIAFVTSEASSRLVCHSDVTDDAGAFQGDEPNVDGVLEGCGLGPADAGEKLGHPGELVRCTETDPVWKHLLGSLAGFGDRFSHSWRRSVVQSSRPPLVTGQGHAHHHHAGVAGVSRPSERE